MIAFRKELLDVADNLAADGRQLTAETVEEMNRNDGEGDGKIYEGNYTKVGAIIYVFGDMRSTFSEICDQINCVASNCIMKCLNACLLDHDDETEISQLL